MGDPQAYPPLPSPAPLPARSSEATRRSIKSRRMSRQLSLSEVPRDAAWERRRRRGGANSDGDVLTDEDLKELKGCIELGFGFNEENGQRLCTTIPALDLYFAVNRVFSPSPISSPTGTGNGSSVSASASAPSLPAAAASGGPPPSITGRSSSFGSALNESDSWKICNPGDDPQHVKTKLRHWAQAVACSVKQSS
ncbi:uncharacterized protein LOC127260963 [Andrographis paniculata]|uniref:uncharacterized protein LOC127260963 n=1 Tax=Andrographis paniculata TaxID=175694 RepID=UPI0021E8163B|nr:uncharacterized protein LOC127260963 [Andrographis paniculata]